MGEAGKTKALVIDGGARMQRRQARSGDISDEQIETFFITLADTCNVVQSARAAGFSANWAYRRRRHDAAFRNGWARAVREGYAKLELVLIERAMKGTIKAIGGGTSDRTIREYSTALGVALLKRHSEIAGDASHDEESDEIREARERILDKLDRIREREEREAAGNSAEAGASESDGIETKGFDRVATVCLALRQAGEARLARAGRPLATRRIRAGQELPGGAR